MDYDQTIKSVPAEMASWIKTITKGVTFKRWEADGKWDGSIGKMLVVKVDLTDVNAMSTKTGIPKKRNYWINFFPTIYYHTVCISKIYKSRNKRC